MMKKKIVKTYFASQNDFFLFLPVRASLISSPVLMIQISGWCQNVAMTCRHNLTESDFLFSISLIQKEKKIRKISHHFSNFSKKSSRKNKQTKFLKIGLC